MKPAPLARWSADLQRLKALTIRQPWAWLVVNGYRDIENPKWATHHRGPLLIHAGSSTADLRLDNGGDTLICNSMACWSQHLPCWTFPEPSLPSPYDRLWRRLQQCRPIIARRTIAKYGVIKTTGHTWNLLPVHHPAGILNTIRVTHAPGQCSVR